jgi:hypothetical protein
MLGCEAGGKMRWGLTFPAVEVAGLAHFFAVLAEEGVVDLDWGG